MSTAFIQTAVLNVHNKKYLYPPIAQGLALLLYKER